MLYDPILPYKTNRALTSQNVILVILIGLAADFDKAGESVILHELMHQILVLL